MQMGGAGVGGRVVEVAEAVMLERIPAVPETTGNMAAGVCIPDEGSGEYRDVAENTAPE